MAGNTDTQANPDVDHTGAAASRPRMWRAAWRQHRSWVIGALALVVAGALLLVATVVLVPACASTSWWETPGATCSVEPAKTFWKFLRLALLTLPVLVGVLLGALTFGQDAESRTQVYALTQGVSRLRWWTAKVAVTAVPVFVAFALLGLATLWAVDAADDSVLGTTRLDFPGFDFLGLIPATRFLVAYAAAAAAALIWRTVGGVVAGLVCVGIVIAVGTLLQPMVVPHQRDVIPIKAWLADDTGMSNAVSSTYGWGGYADAAGRDIDTMTLDCQDADFNACLASHVTYRVETYVRDSEYPRMMLTISGFNLLIAGGAFALGARDLRRRDL